MNDLPEDVGDATDAELSDRLHEGDDSEEVID